MHDLRVIEMEARRRLAECAAREEVLRAALDRCIHLSSLDSKIPASEIIDIAREALALPMDEAALFEYQEKAAGLERLICADICQDMANRFRHPMQARAAHGCGQAILSRTKV